MKEKLPRRHRFVMNLKASFSELLPLSFHLMLQGHYDDSNVSASLPHFPSILLHLYTSILGSFLGEDLPLPVSPSSLRKPTCHCEAPQGIHNNLQTECGGTGCL